MMPANRTISGAGSPAEEAAEPRRRSRRFEIVASARFRWTGYKGAKQASRGKTRDLSVDGVFVWAWPVPPPGTPIEITIDIPERYTNGRPLRLSGQGTVVRVDPHDGQARGFAAQVRFSVNNGTEALLDFSPTNDDSPRGPSGSTGAHGNTKRISRAP